MRVLNVCAANRFSSCNILRLLQTNLDFEQEHELRTLSWRTIKTISPAILSWRKRRSPDPAPPCTWFFAAQPFTLRPLSSSGVARDGAPTSFPVLQPAAVLYLILYASLPYPQFAPFSFSTPSQPDNVGEPYQGNAE